MLFLDLVVMLKIKKNLASTQVEIVHFNETASNQQVRIVSIHQSRFCLERYLFPPYDFNSLMGVRTLILGMRVR